MAVYERQYTQGVGWENEPSVNTPISAENLNQMDMAIQDVDEAAAEAFAALEEEIQGAGSLSGLTDVNLSSLADANILRYMSSQAKWINTIEHINTYENTQSGSVSSISVSGYVFRNGDIVLIHFANSITPSGQYWVVDGGMVPYPIKKQDGSYFSDSISAGTYLALAVNSSGNCFVVLNNESGGGGSSTLAGLTDTNINNPSNKQVLKYNSVSGKWINSNDDTVKVRTVHGTASSGTIVVPESLISVGDDDIMFVYITADASREAWYLEYTAGGVTEENEILDLLNGTPTSPEFNSALTAGETLIIIGGMYFVGRIPAAGGGGASTLAGLTDTNISSPSDGQYLKYDSTSSKWINASGGGGGASTLSDLTDTTITTPTASQPLTYDATNSKWINGGVIPTANGGTGNADGYIRTGIRTNTNAGTRATIEGLDNTGTGTNSHVEGTGCSATANQAHAEGNSSTASGQQSHAEGRSCTAGGLQSHAEGYGSSASGQTSHAQGRNTTASAENTSAAGYYTTAGYLNQFVIGKYNDNKSANLFEIGNGTAANAKSNALEVDGSGNVVAGGNVSGASISVPVDPTAAAIADMPAGAIWLETVV